MAGAGLKTPEELERPQSQCIPANTIWIRQDVSHFEPEKNSVQLDNGDKVEKKFHIQQNTFVNRFPTII